LKSLKNTHVDIVYLWVDGNDPKWRKKRQRAAQSLKSTTDLALFSNVEGRFRDNEELRFSLRALEKFFPSHGHIYIVTDSQTPSWLAQSNEISIIDHRDLIPTDLLPTFDSGNIESYIHRIENLSERYFYLNDDVFFGAPVDLKNWFWNDGVYVAWSDESEVSDEPLRMDATSLENACRLSNIWLSQLADQTQSNYSHIFRTFAHAPRPMIRSVMYMLEKELADIFETVRTTTFRTWDKPTIVADFVLRWKLEHGLAKMRDYAHLYISTGEKDYSVQLTHLSRHIGRVDFFCINDTTDNAPANDPRLKAARQTLEQLFPIPSNFEFASLTLK